ncbi:trehalose 6-phosphate synthase [Bradyrhizobium sp. USDA 10063]
MSLVVVSNRVARGRANEPMTGGLAAALLPVVEQSGAIWVGSSGQLSYGAQPEPAIEPLGRGKLVTLDLPAKHYSGYYNGFANSALWPALHSRTDLIDVSDLDYLSYCEINAVMARALLQFKEQTAFWGHDYHFLALGAELRKVGINQPIGFFLHTPWPVPAMMQCVPYHGQLIAAMLAYDLIGFQTDEDRRNFLACVGPPLGRITEDGIVNSRHGRTRCRVFPIGIDANKFAQYSAKSISHPVVASLRRSLNGGKLAIGVDRIDYSKGLDNRVDAFDHLWKEQPRSISLLQVANPSRSGINVYRNLQNFVARLVRDVNRRHGAVDWTPIRYLNASFSQSVLAGLYRTAKVGVVTPLRDGMNLVAKEYVAAQDPGDPGVLVLSKFAGAAKELDGALLVDPHDIEDMARVISRAVSMQPDERSSRWEAMMQKLRGYTIQQWFSDFVAELEESRAEKVVGEFLPRGVGAPSGSKRRKVEDDSAGTSSHLALPRQLSYPAVDVQARVPDNDFGHIVGLGFSHGLQTAPDVLLGALNRSGLFPRPFQPPTNFYIQGHPYSAQAQLGVGVSRVTPNNPLGVQVILIPRLKGG